MIKSKFYFLLFLLLAACLFTNAQDPARYKDAVANLSAKEYQFSPDKKLVVFAGSSSIRMWKDVQDYFPGFNVINNGFGGSQYSDLIYYSDQLIMNRKPDIVFIYEGDNDIAANKKPADIAKEAKSLIQNIEDKLPDTEIVVISAKPCIKRWELRENYKKLNRRLFRLTKKSDQVEFANVWNVMLDSKGKLYQDIFLDDGVHMNKKGYDLWAKEIGKFLQ
ncbi:MAG: GDSL-type esterase/lipase family protein [Draconibacterium sp.]